MESVESLDEPVTLPGEWPNLLERGQIFTALLLSTSYSEWLELKQMFCVAIDADLRRLKGVDMIQGFLFLNV